MNRRPRMRLTFDPEVGTIFFIPDKSKSGEYLSKRGCRNPYDTNYFLAISRAEDESLNFLRVYGKPVENGMRLKKDYIWIKLDDFIKIPRDMLVKSGVQPDDPEELLHVIAAERFLMVMCEVFEEELKEQTKVMEN